MERRTFCDSIFLCESFQAIVTELVASGEERTTSGRSTNASHESAFSLKVGEAFVPWRIHWRLSDSCAGSIETIYKFSMLSLSKSLYLEDGTAEEVPSRT